MKIVAQFFKSNGILQHCSLVVQKTVTNNCFIEQYLPKIIEFLKNLRQIDKLATWFFNRDKASDVYLVKAYTNYLITTRLKVMTVQTLLPATSHYFIIWKWRWNKGGSAVVRTIWIPGKKRYYNSIKKVADVVEGLDLERCGAIEVIKKN